MTRLMPNDPRHGRIAELVERLHRLVNPHIYRIHLDDVERRAAIAATEDALAGELNGGAFFSFVEGMNLD